MLGPEHDITVNAENDFARLLETRLKYAEAEPMFREAMEQSIKKRGTGHPNVLITMMNYERFLKNRRRYAESEVIARQALDAARANLGNDHRVTIALIQDMGQIQYKLGHNAEGEVLLRESLERRRMLFGDNDLETIGSLNGLGQFLIDTKRYADAEPVCAELYQASAKSQMNPRSVASNMSQWGICLAKLSRYEQAEAPLLEAYRRLDESGIRRSDAMLAVMTAMGDVCEHTNRPAEAAKWRADFRTLEAATRPSTQSTRPATTNPENPR